MKLLHKIEEAAVINNFYAGTILGKLMNKIFMNIKEREIKVLSSPKTSNEQMRDSQGAIRIINKLLTIEAESLDFLKSQEKKGG